MFEIGGVDATHEATAIGKDVFEPMSWERYRSPEGKENAFHIIHGGGPRELRVNLQGRPCECDEGLLELMKQQIEDGGTVVVTGSCEDYLLYDIRKDPVLREARQHHSEEQGKFFAVMFRPGDDSRAAQCGDRVHEVKMVSTGEGGRKNKSSLWEPPASPLAKTRPAMWRPPCVVYTKILVTLDKKI